MNGFASMLQVCLTWAVLFIVVFLITRSLGLNSNLPARALELMKAVRRLSDTIKGMYPETCTDGQNGSLPDRKKVFALLKKLNRKAVNADSLLQVQLYDKGSDSDLSAARTRISSIREQCSDAARNIRLDAPQGVRTDMESIERSCDEIMTILESITRSHQEEDLMKL